MATTGSLAVERELRKNYISILSDGFEDQRAIDGMTKSGGIIKDLFLGLTAAVLNRLQPRALAAASHQARARELLIETEPLHLSRERQIPDGSPGDPDF
jgi:hypothetical protein